MSRGLFLCSLCSKELDTKWKNKLSNRYYAVEIGGGIPESRRAAELTELLGVNILPSQVIF